jgi:hypothetical protein
MPAADGSATFPARRITSADGADPMPQPPPRPEPEDCCGSGCARCVFEVYVEARERYEEALRAWQARHADPG